MGSAYRSGVLAARRRTSQQARDCDLAIGRHSVIGSRRDRPPRRWSRPESAAAARRQALTAGVRHFVAASVRHRLRGRRKDSVPRRGRNQRRPRCASTIQVGRCLDLAITCSARCRVTLLGRGGRSPVKKMAVVGRLGPSRAGGGLGRTCPGRSWRPLVRRVPVRRWPARPSSVPAARLRPATEST